MSGGAPAASLLASDWLGQLGEFAQANPVAVAGVVVGVLLLVAGASKAIPWLRRSAGDELLSVLRNQESVTVLTHPNPDPDAMGSAAAVATLAEHEGTDATIRYPGEIRHPQNRAFRTVLDLDLERIGVAADVAGEAIVLVDHNVPRGFRGAEQLDPLAVIDHHPGDGDGSAFTDVRPDHGACASIVAEYLDDLDADLAGPDDDVDQDDDELVVPTGVVTGLAFGILSDTSHLTDGCSMAEFEASAYLHRAIDRDLLNRIQNPRVDAESLEVKARAITDREVRSPYAVSDVGTISNVDAIPQAASELVNLETVTAVVVVGDDGETIHLSGRSRDDRVHMGEVIEDVADDIPMASGGGHARMGGGQIDIQHMEGLGPGSGIDREELVERLFAAMSGREVAERAADGEG